LDSLPKSMVLILVVFSGLMDIWHNIIPEPSDFPHQGSRKEESAHLAISEMDFRY
jgi:hypothetical protein